jgi:hypothetical protein
MYDFNKFFTYIALVEEDLLLSLLLLRNASAVGEETK